MSRVRIPLRPGIVAARRLGWAASLGVAFLSATSFAYAQAEQAAPAAGPSSAASEPSAAPSGAPSGASAGAPSASSGGGSPQAGARDCKPLETREPNAPDQRPIFPAQTRACAITSPVAFDVVVQGSVALVMMVSLVGVLSFTGFAVLCAARTASVEVVSGFINALTLPMWLVSGTFFSYERFPEALHPFIQALPLTALGKLDKNALRARHWSGQGRNVA